MVCAVSVSVGESLQREYLKDDRIARNVVSSLFKGCVTLTPRDIMLRADFGSCRSSAQVLGKIMHRAHYSLSSIFLVHSSRIGDNLTHRSA